MTLGNVAESGKDIMQSTQRHTTCRVAAAAAILLEFACEDDDDDVARAYFNYVFKNKRKFGLECEKYDTAWLVAPKKV